MFKVNLLIFLFFVVILALGVVKKRFWCRYLCPLGTLFSIVSRFRILKRFVTEDCTHCQKCVKECPVGAIHEASPQEYRQQDCISCFKCLECPPEAVSFHFGFPRWRAVNGVNLSRRYVLGSLAFGAVSALMIKANPLQSESGMRNNRLIRPPGSLPEEEFVSVCTGCGECLKVCPNNALQSTFWRQVWPAFTLRGSFRASVTVKSSVISAEGFVPPRPSGLFPLKKNASSRWGSLISIPRRPRQPRQRHLALCRCRQVPPLRRRRDVPQFPRHPRRGALHPRPRPVCSGR